MSAVNPVNRVNPVNPMPKNIHLSRLIHQGTPSAPGEVGTADPNVWIHLLLIGGRWHVARLKCDVIQAAPDLAALHTHYRENPEWWIPLPGPQTNVHKLPRP